jgi:hypothetical protein
MQKTHLRQIHKIKATIPTTTAYGNPTTNPKHKKQSGLKSQTSAFNHFAQNLITQHQLPLP